MFVAQRDFNEEEYLVPKEILEQNDILVDTFASQQGEAQSTGETKIIIEKTIDDFFPREYEALILVGGGGALVYLDNEIVLRKVREILEQGKLLGAICIAPTILAKAGILQGKKATAWTNQTDKKSIEVLQKGGAQYIEEAVVIDGQIITAAGPWAAREFGEKFLKQLNQAA